MIQNIALMLVAVSSLTAYLWGVMIIRDAAKQEGYRHNLWTVIVATTVNLGAAAFLIRRYADNKEVSA